MDDETIDSSASDDAGRSVDASPTDEPAATTPPGRSRLAVAMFVGAGLLVIAAVVFGVLGLQAQSATSDERHKTAAATSQRHELADQQHELQGERADLRKEALALPDKYDAVYSSFSGLADSHNHFIDELNHAVELYNSGDFAGGAAVIQGDAATAANDVAAKKAQTQQAVQAAEDALHHLQEAL
jgi:hypothetical protein